MSAEAAFDAVGREARALLRREEAFTLGFSAESSTFIRFNGGRVRQAGQVGQAEVALRWMSGRRHVVESFTLSGDAEVDRARLLQAVERSRGALERLSDDPLLLVSEEPTVSEAQRGGDMPDGDEIIGLVTEEARGVDLVGIWQAGPVYRGFTSSFGHHHWLSASSWAFDFTVVASADRAAKQTLGGEVWAPERLRRGIRESAALLPLLARDPVTVGPGRYRAWLTPVALSEVMSLLSAFGDFGGRASMTRSSALSRLASGERRLNAAVSLYDDVAAGTAPAWQADGFVRPDRVPLVEAGRHAGSVISPRTGVEFGVAHNGADGSEVPVALAMEGGALDAAEAMAALGTGVWVSNLWYLNHSDRNQGRFTGMTRFATLWVEDGRPVGPLAVMRFDDSLYELLGERLEGLSRQTELLPTVETYGGRSTSSMRLPGMLVSGLTFTL